MNYYLLPGNVTTTAAFTSINGIPFAQKSVIYSLAVYSTYTYSSGDYVTVNLYNSSLPLSTAAGNLFATCQILFPNNSAVIILNNFSSTFFSGRFLVVQLVTPPNANLPTSSSSSFLYVTLTSY